nr:hypothetical transcript [Hymenolepis microstoma]
MDRAKSTMRGRGHPGLNRGPLDLQSNALPLSYTPWSRGRKGASLASPHAQGINNLPPPLFTLAALLPVFSHHATPRNTTQHHATPRNTTQHHIAQPHFNHHLTSSSTLPPAITS